MKLKDDDTLKRVDTEKDGLGGMMTVNIKHKYTVSHPTNNISKRLYKQK